MRTNQEDAFLLFTAAHSYLHLVDKSPIPLTLKLFIPVLPSVEALIKCFEGGGPVFARRPTERSPGTVA